MGRLAQQERCQGRVDIGSASLTAPEAVGRKDRHLRRLRVNLAVGPRLVRGLRSVRFSGGLLDPQESITDRLCQVSRR